MTANAIIEKNAPIGIKVTISPDAKLGKVDREHYYIRDGIVVIPMKCARPHGSVV